MGNIEMTKEHSIARGEVLWQPNGDQVKNSRLHAFKKNLNERFDRRFLDYQSLYRFSIDEPTVFWGALWDFLSVVGDGPGEEVVREIHRMPGAQWFPEARLNFAENILRFRGKSEAVVGIRENGSREALTHDQLYQSVAQLAAALRAAGLKPGDRVAAYLPNMNSAIVAALAATSLGASWASVSPDWAVSAVLDRLEQVQPRFLFVTDQSEWKGRLQDMSKSAAAIAAALPSIEKVIVVPYQESEPNLTSDIPNSVSLANFIQPYSHVDTIEFERVPFTHPLFILFTSGTTGKPKCIVHGHGGVLIQFMKEHQLHWDVQPGDRVFRATTTGWMIWQHCLTTLASGATVVNYSGSPLYPDRKRLLDVAESEKISILGVPSALLDEYAKANLNRPASQELPALKCLLSSGSPLTPEHYRFVYDEIKRDIHFASPTGGTDLAAAFASGNPIGPVRAGETQVLALGMKVEIFDSEGESLVGEPGELVCTQAFPSVPIGFLNDPGDERFLESYFEMFPNVWRHGDWAEITTNGGLVIHGRSDATLNAKGVRIGTSEIYQHVEQIPDIVDCVAVEQEWQTGTRVVLFVKLSKNIILDDDLTLEIQQTLRENASPRHVPDRIIQVADIPTTATGKSSEIAVREVIHGRPVNNASSLANPEVLKLFENLPELAA